MTDLHLVLLADPHDDDLTRAQFVRELIVWVRTELNIAPQILGEEGGAAPDGVTTRDAMVWAALLVSIPGAVGSTIALADRIQLKERLRRLGGWLRGRRRRATLRTSVGELALPGDDERALDEIVDQLARELERATQVEP